VIADVIAKERISAAEFERLATWALMSDAIARGTTLELAIHRFRDKSKVGASVRALAKKFSGQSGKEKYDPFELLSAAFLMVYGELGKTRVLASKPAFWRRLAALAQAALITRCVLSTNNDLSEFIPWMRSVRSSEYQMQCLVDLRSEPRWLADFALAGQLKNEIGGRVLLAAGRDEEATDRLGLRHILFSDTPQSLKAQLNLLLTQLPGPLEGNIDSPMSIGSKDLAEMRNDLSDPSG
jgi:hypothetical protein